jgi:cysteine/glycine-rich protein
MTIKMLLFVNGIAQVQSNSKVSSMFAGTQEKCVACKKTVYPIERVNGLLS